MSHEVERLEAHDLQLIKPLLVDLHLEEQRHYPDHPQLGPEEVEAHLPQIRPTFQGENVVLAIRDPGGAVAGFCWVVLFDPGTGLEGEVAELYVAEGERGHGVGRALVGQAVRLFEERGVTLGYAWTRHENEPATRVYRSSGFEPTRQLILTWYPIDRAGDA